MQGIRISTSVIYAKQEGIEILSGSRRPYVEGLLDDETSQDFDRLTLLYMRPM